MMKSTFFSRLACGSALFFLCHLTPLAAQTLAPDEFLGYALGERFTPHHRLVSYVAHVASTNGNVEMVPYGTTYEQRPLLVAVVSSPENMANLENIRRDNLRRAGLEPGDPTTRIPIIWLSYNVHGNEAVSSEVALKTLWELVNPANATARKWLENTVVIIDPCLNPDGHERYVSWYTQKANKRMQPDPQSAEHAEPWPGGRPNHYLFDLNRDWAWQVQQESRARVNLYHRWMPQVHVDFHEQGVDAPYYFAPAAEPVHALVSDFQREFQEVVGRNNARYFDEQAWLYFTREVFDLFYPSYGDSWPMFNGAIGMTYEQGGSGRAGLGILTALGDTLTLADRIRHHYTSGMATIETVAGHADRLLDEFTRYFGEGGAHPGGKYRSFVVKPGASPERLSALKRLLDRNGIRYGQAGGNHTKQRGFDYFTGKAAAFTLEEGDLIVSTYQPKGVLAQALFEPNPALSDSLTYDITSWALPYTYGLQAYALETRLEADAVPDTVFRQLPVTANPVAYIVPWTSVQHARFLAALLNAGIRVRFAGRPFSVSGRTYPAGSLIIGRAGNEQGDFHGRVAALAGAHEVPLEPVTTGFVDSGKDFGSAEVRAIRAPEIALIGGNGTASLHVGEVWHFLEQELDYPLSVLEPDMVASADLSRYTVIILPPGNYRNWGEETLAKLSAWVAAGGKLIVIEGAVEYLSGKSGFGVSPYLTQTEKQAAEKAQEVEKAAERTIDFKSRERARISDAVLGAVFEVRMDASYPLGFGTGGTYYTLKNSGQRFAYLKDGINAGIIPDMSYHRSGFVGAKAKERLASSLVFGVEHRGRGQVVYLVDNPLFRGFWEYGKLVMSNALFMVGQ